MTQERTTRRMLYALRTEISQELDSLSRRDPLYNEKRSLLCEQMAAVDESIRNR